MQLRRIEISAFRKLGHAVVDGLSDGLNVIVGDNEAGKSTLLAALRAVLFERHRVGGKVLAAMLPHGHDVRPEVTIDFAIGDAAFGLRKAFNQRPEAELTLPGGQKITGDAVEERLAELLGFQAPGSRGSKPDEHQGVYGLLWVDQGLAHAPLNAGAGQNTLSSALESEVGLVLGGERGRQLVARAQERRETFWDKRDRPRGGFRIAQEQVATLEEQRAALEQRLRRHDEQVAALAAKHEILSRHRRDDRLGVTARAVEAARGAVARAGQLEAALTDVRRAGVGAAVERDTAAERLRQRQSLIERAAATEAAAARARDDATTAEANLRRAEDGARFAERHWEKAKRSRQESAQQLAALDRHEALRRTRADLVQAGEVLTRAETIACKRREALAVAARITVGAADLAELDRLCAARDLARSRRDAAGVQITTEPGAPAITVDGVPHSGESPLLLARDAVLDLPGFGRLRVRPGGGVEALARALEETEARVAALLARLGFSGRNGVAEALARRMEAEAEAAMQDRLFAVVAPAGLEWLRQQVETLRAADVADAEARPDPDQDRPTLTQALARAQLAEAATEADAKRADGEREAVSRQVAVLGERVAASMRDHDSALHALAAARATPDDTLAAALAKAAQATTLAREAERAAEAALASADPETASLALRRAEQAEKAIRADIDTVTREKRDLEIELRTLGQEGYGEQFAAIEGQLAAARQNLARQTLEAAGSRLLYATLADAQHETKDRFLGPVRERVQPYLRLLQPGSDIVLNEKTFAIEHLLRDGVPEPFETLSVGAREQIAVITRLALADTLHASGQPSAIILDDALVNTDEERLERMHLVLQKAAERLQVLVLTCRERDFVDLGAPIHRL